jgi:AraC family transcriptional regulator, chemosensory pili system protein ChpD
MSGMSTMPAVHRVRALLAERFADKVHLDELARVAGISKFHLLRQFRAATGLTPQQYQRHLRIEKAKLALDRGESASEVAFACGFVDQSHFTRAFRACTGVTPGRYAQVARQAPADDCSAETGT